MSTRLGYAYGIAAYFWWGAFPVFFMLLAVVDPFELIPWRVFTAFGFCLIVVTLVRGWGPILAIFRNPKLLGWFVLSSLCLYANWQIFVTGVVTGHIIETALGYFINPLFTILIGVLLRGEKMPPMQWAAVGVAGVGVLISAIAYGEFPWIALGVATSFALYGAVRKQMSENIDALSGFTVETFIAVPVALLQLWLVYVFSGALGAFDHGPAVTIPLLLSGTVTAIPLLLFGASNRRLPLTQMGFIQFLTPILGFLTGYLIYGEEMTFVRWAGFIAVWVALILLVADMVRRMRTTRLQ